MQEFAKIPSVLIFLIFEVESRTRLKNKENVEDNRDPDTKEDIETFPWWIWFIIGDILLIAFVVTCCKFWLCGCTKVKEDSCCNEADAQYDRRNSNVNLIPQFQNEIQEATTI